MVRNRFSDFIVLDLDLDQDSSNFVDPDTINPDPRHWFTQRKVTIIWRFLKETGNGLSCIFKKAEKICLIENKWMNYPFCFYALYCLTFLKFYFMSCLSVVVLICLDYILNIFSRIWWRFCSLSSHTVCPGSSVPA